MPSRPEPGRPIRTCIGCGRKKAKSELVRLVANGKKEVVRDQKGTMPGRGAYLCPSSKCFEAAVKAKRFYRAFRGPVSTRYFDENQGLEGNDT